MVDWGGELCAVIGKRCYQVPEDDALAFVGGYTIMNDVSARDWTAEGLKSQEGVATLQDWVRSIQGKQFPSFAPMGPFVVTTDEIADPGDLHLTTTLNGILVQDAHTSGQVCSFAQLISYHSRFRELLPGDIITSGSPSGSGLRRDPQMFMSAGDMVEVCVDRIGTLSNPVLPA